MLCRKKIAKPYERACNYMCDLFKNQFVVCVRLLNLHSSTTVV